MYEPHDDTGVSSAANQAEPTPPRAPWQRPSLRAMPARDAEVGVSVNISDGAFTTS
jgi:hypothetical protein